MVTNGVTSQGLISDLLSFVTGDTPSASFWSAGTGTNAITTINGNNISGYRAFSGQSIYTAITINTLTDLTSMFTSNYVIFNDTILGYDSTTFNSPNFNIILTEPYGNPPSSVLELTYTAMTNAGLDIVDDTGYDDNFFEIGLPSGYTCNFFGTAFTNVFINTNGYLTFGNGTDSCCDNLPEDIPNFNTNGGVFLSISSQDGKSCIIYSGLTNGGDNFVIRFEGNYLSTGSQNCGEPDLVYNYIFYKHDTTRIDMVIDSNPYFDVDNDNLSGVNNGDNTYQYTFDGSSNKTYKLYTNTGGGFVTEIDSVVADLNHLDSLSAPIIIGDNSFVVGNNSFALNDNINILGSNITGFTSGTTYVDKLNVKTIPVNNIEHKNHIGIDNNGNLIKNSITKYVLGWEEDRQLGNITTLGYGKGKILFTQDSNMFIGVNGADFNNDSNFDSPSYFYEIAVKIADNTFVFIDIDDITGSTIGSIGDIYDNNQRLNSLGNIWFAETGEYNYYTYFIPQAKNDNSFAEGYGTIAEGYSSHAEGKFTQANGTASHAEGSNTVANGTYSHAGGYSTTANGTYSFVHGNNSIANNSNTIVLGGNITGINPDTTYVDNLNIKSLPAGTSVTSLGLDIDGNVIASSGGGSVYNYSNIGSSSSNITIDFSSNNIQKLTLVGHSHISFANMTTGYPYRLITVINAETFNSAITFPSTYIFDKGNNPYSFSVLPTIDTVFTSTTDSTISVITLQPDGKILLGGGFTTYSGQPRNRIVRINQDGTLDYNFVIGTGFNDSVNVITLQPDGKILVGGNFITYSGVSKNKLVRLTSGGTIDSTFNIGTGFNSSVNAITIQPDGKILVGGNFITYSGSSKNRLIRLNSDGTIDNTFNIGTGFNYSVNAIALQPDNKIIVGGAFNNFVVRLNSDGSLDTSFSTGFILLPESDYVKSIAIQPNGKIILGNYSSIATQIFRLNSDGSLDSSFNYGTNFDNTVNNVLLLPNGKILTAGYFSVYNGNPAAGIARLNSDGSFDSTFKMGGGLSGTPYGFAIAQQPDKKILISGNMSAFSGVTTDKLIRINNIDYPKVNIIDIVTDGTNIILK